MSLQSVAQAIATTGPLFCAGYNFCAGRNVVPRLYQEPPSVSAPIFAHLFTTGSNTIIPIALTSAAASVYLAYVLPLARPQWIVAAVVVMATAPYTRFVMYPNIRRLLALADDAAAQQKAAATGEHIGFLQKWSWQSNLRSILFFIGGLTATVASGGGL